MIKQQNSPAMVEVTRGVSVESCHPIDICVSDTSGTLVHAWGNADISIFPRSAIKSLQALLLIESGAADAFALGYEHLALTCSSHNGESAHVRRAGEILNAAGLSETCLECGAHLPRRFADRATLIKSDGEASPVHNACSGKHAGLLALASHLGFETDGYIDFSHPVQREVAGVLETVTGAPHGEDNYGIDGCSIPTYRIPLKNLATAYARFGVGEDESKMRSSAMLRLRDACFAHPEMVAGKKRTCTTLMRALPGRVFVKFGAEGVYTASLPELGLGIAMKVRDGSARAIEVAIAALISKLLTLNDSEASALETLANPVLKNWNGMEVGTMRFVS